MHKLFCSLVMASATFVSATGQEPYHVADHWKLGGTGGWDYLLADPSEHRLYVTHNSRVEVVDTHTGKAVGAITGLKRTHGVALDDHGRYGYISDGGANAVVIFDRKSLTSVRTVSTGINPDGIVYEPTTKTIWAFNGRSNNVTVIGTADLAVVATIALPGKPEFPQADGKGKVFVNIEDRNSVVELDASKNVLLNTWKLDDCDSPSGMAIDRDHGRVFSVCDGKKMAILDTATGKQLGSAQIGDGPDAAAFDPRHQLIFASSGDGVVSVVDAAHQYQTLETLPTMKGGRTMAYDEKNDVIYVVSAEYGLRPAASTSNPWPRPSVTPDTFQILVIKR